MKVYAARYTSCKYEYGPSVMSLHMTKEGAEKAVAFSQSQSRESFREMQEWLKDEEAKGNGVFDTGDEWTFENGDGFEKWMVTEMEVEE